MNQITETGIAKKVKYVHTVSIIPIKYKNEYITGVIVDHHSRDIDNILRVLYKSLSLYCFAREGNYLADRKNYRRSFLVSPLSIDQITKVVEICARKLNHDFGDSLVAKIEPETTFDSEFEKRYTPILNSLVKIWAESRKKIPAY